MNQNHPKSRIDRLWLTALACIAWPLFGQPASLRFEHIASEQGLSHQTVTCVFQDSQGFIWFGTIDGLNLYDGYHCRVYKHDPGDPGSLSSSFIHTVVQDHSENLWIGTRDGGLSLLTPAGRKTGQFQHFLPLPGQASSLSHAKINTIYIDRAGRVLVGTQTGLDRFEPETRSFSHFRFFSPTSFPLNVSRLWEDSQGLLWIATFDGVYAVDSEEMAAIDPESGRPRMKHYRHDPADPNSLPANLISSLFQDSQGRLWCGTRGGGISLFDRATETFRTYRHDPRDPRSLSRNNANVAFEDASGMIWVTTDGGGLNILDPATGAFSHYRHQPSRSESLSHDNVGHIYQSRDGLKGTIWVTTWGGGVNKLIEEDKPFRWVQHDPDNPNSLSSNFVFGLCEDRFGDLWVGANGGGLDIWNRETGQWRHFLPDAADPRSLSALNIWSIYEDRGGDIWIATEHGGLCQVERRQRNDPVRFIRHRFEPERESSLSEDSIRVFFQDLEGSYWVGYEEQGLSRQTLAQRAADAWTHFRHVPGDPDSLSDDMVRTIYQDSAGTIWVGTFLGGLNKIAPTAGGTALGAHFSAFQHNPGDATSLASNDVRSILQTGDGRLWVGTYGGGLDLFNPETETFRHFTVSEGLANNFVYGLLEDSRGSLWISTNRGLSELQLATETFTNYGTQHGLQSDEFNTGAYFKSRHGELFFGGVNGFNYFDPEELALLRQRQSDYRPSVALTGFTIMGRPLPANPGQVVGETIRLAHTDQFFSFEMAVLDYHNPEKNQFRYMLEGFNRDWVENGNRHFGSYTNLDPGSYRLRYQGADNNGAWNEGPPLRILITPPFWQTWWFAALTLVCLLLALVVAARIVKYYRAYRGLHYVGHFKILEKLGEGGCGTVYRARNKISRRIVALKVLNSRMEETRDGIRRFLQEAEIGSRLVHPHIVAIFEAGSQGKTRFISMEYLKGYTLKQHLMETGKLSLEEIYPLAVQILSGLAAIHLQEIVHRDLKAANIMLLENRSLKIMDFGLARISALTTMENRNQMMGTLAYMSPEQTMGKGVDHRSDIYSLGVILYEMALGRLPFSGENEMEMIYAIHNEKPPGLNEIANGSLAELIATCLAKEPHNRFPSVDELRNAFDRLVRKADPPAPAR